MTFPERGLVVAVMANISFADTKSIALHVAQAFAEQLNPLLRPKAGRDYFPLRYSTFGAPDLARAMSRNVSPLTSPSAKPYADPF